MKNHLLISTLLDSLIYFNDVFFCLNNEFIRKFAAYSATPVSFYQVEVDQLLERLVKLEELYHDKNLKVKSKINVLAIRGVLSMDIWTFFMFYES
jgi:hypothetical protein